MANGKHVAEVVPIQNADLETLTLSTHPQFLALIERSRSRQETRDRRWNLHRAYASTGGAQEESARPIR